MGLFGKKAPAETDPVLDGAILYQADDRARDATKRILRGDTQAAILAVLASTETPVAAVLGSVVSDIVVATNQRLLAFMRGKQVPEFRYVEIATTSIGQIPGSNFSVDAITETGQMYQDNQRYWPVHYLIVDFYDPNDARKFHAIIDSARPGARV